MAGANRVPLSEQSLRARLHQRGLLASVGETLKMRRRVEGSEREEFLAWSQVTQPPAGLTKATVQAYRAHLVDSGLSSSTINLEAARFTTGRVFRPVNRGDRLAGESIPPRKASSRR